MFEFLGDCVWVAVMNWLGTSIIGLGFTIIGTLLYLPFLFFIKKK